MIEATGKIEKQDNNIVVTISVSDRYDLVEEVARLEKQFNGYCNLKISRPYRPRTTGERSQNRAINGGCGAIAEQSGGRYYSREIKDILKYLTIDDYPEMPHIHDEKGRIIPSHEDTWSSQHANWFIERMNRFADEHNFWLWQYDDTQDPPVPYRSYGGRSLKEMRLWYPELNKEIK
jgi:hypothetical protein